MTRFVQAACLAAASLAASASAASANTIAQNVSWTIEREAPTGKYRLAAYGDSLYAGYKGSISEVATWNAPNVFGEYASNHWNADIEIVRRAKSGAKADDIYANKIVDDDQYMQHESTRIVTFEMCGNDGLSARNKFAEQDEGTSCDYTELEEAVATCVEYLEKAMIYINNNSHPEVKLKVVSNLYYPGYDEDDELSACNDPETGTPVNRQDVFLRYLARINWNTCNFAHEFGFECADTFAQFMGSDYDSNGDGRTDWRALRYVHGESEDDYVERLSVTLRETIRDPNTHFVNADTSRDYIRSDNTHPTYRGGETDVGPLGGSGGGEGPPRFAPERYRRNFKNPVWRKFGHERFGRTLAIFTPDTPD
ncbi:MAG TPA: SGNH/GDSL hydrolase family protein [Candidatus Limnocylindrales bacterium]|nr:SGNH/GDSL hydrolase family protein [Candidatus Limnocylindrales bacterium]